MTAVDDHRHKSIPPTGANGIKLAHKMSATQEKVQPYLRCDISCCSQRMQSYSYGQWVGKSAQNIFLLYAPVWNMKDTNGFYYFWSIWLLKWARLSCLLILLFAYRNAFQVKRFSFCSTRWPEPILRFFFSCKHVRTFGSIESGNALLSYPNWKQVNSLSISLTMCVCSLLLLQQQPSVSYKTIQL